MKGKVNKFVKEAKKVNKQKVKQIQEQVRSGNPQFTRVKKG